MTSIHLQRGSSHADPRTRVINYIRAPSAPIVHSSSFVAAARLLFVFSRLFDSSG